MDSIKRKPRYWPLFLLSLGMLASASCAKNVDKIDFTKWGNSFVVPQKNVSGMDTTANGGSPQDGVVPESPNFKAPKAAVGGAYQRGFAASANYRLVGGFHLGAPRAP